MIRYQSSAFGFIELTRFDGSAAAKAAVVATFSTVVYFLMYYYSGVQLAQNHLWRVDEHPYPIGALVVAFTFLLVFRANFSYQRYWEAATYVHQMMSKWLDVGIELAAFHLQSAQYDSIRPPTFGEHPELKSIVRERQRHNPMTLSMIEEKMNEDYADDDDEDDGNNAFCSFLGLRPRKKKSHVISVEDLPIRSINSAEEEQDPLSINPSHPCSSKIPLPRHPPSFIVPTGLKMSYGTLGGSLSKLKSVSRLDGGMEDRTPSLFLQEMTHLISLLSAVAMSTLRNDNEFAESPLVAYVPGEPWPPVDPDKLDSSIRREYNERYRFNTIILFLTGATRDEKHRTLYNAARPFTVLGGVSDAECELLQAARGPYAKVALCSMWLQEFISREYLHGSTGQVAPPILSRLFQYTSDGMVGYNEARKIAYVPFPFPHSQLTSLFIFVLSFIFFPALNLCWGNYVWWAAILNFFTVLCFAGIHEVARELEEPYENTPNDLPLTTWQAEFNEALVTTYAGYNPDSYWTAPSVAKVSSSSDGSGAFVKWTDTKDKGIKQESKASTQTH